MGNIYPCMLFLLHSLQFYMHQGNILGEKDLWPQLKPLVYPGPYVSLVGMERIIDGWMDTQMSPILYPPDFI